MKYKSHPAAAIFPLMQPSELEILAADIKANGLLEPILLIDDQILDGRNRLAACESAGVEPRFEQAEINGQSPTLFVLSKNLHRRHLKTSQKAAVAVAVLPMLREEARERERLAGAAGGRMAGSGRPKNRGSSNWNYPYSANENKDSSSDSCLDSGRSLEHAARALGIGTTTIFRAMVVQQKDPSKFEELARGVVTANKAYREVGCGRLLHKGPSFSRRKKHQPTGARRKAAPPAVGTKRRPLYEQAAKRRLVRCLSQVRGLCRGLAELNTDLLAPVLTGEEQITWIRIAAETSRVLSQLGRKLEQLEQKDGTQKN